MKRVTDGDGYIAAEEIVANAVHGKEGSANAEWSKWTPVGQLSFTVNNPAAFESVRPGQYFFIELVPTDKDGI